MHEADFIKKKIRAQRCSQKKKILAQAIGQKKNSCKPKIPHPPPPHHFSNGPSLNCSAVSQSYASIYGSSFITAQRGPLARARYFFSGRLKNSFGFSFGGTLRKKGIVIKYIIRFKNGWNWKGLSHLKCKLSPNEHRKYLSKLYRTG